MSELAKKSGGNLELIFQPANYWPVSWDESSGIIRYLDAHFGEGPLFRTPLGGGRPALAALRKRVGRIDPIRFVGEGTQGIAFELPSGVIMKLTADEGELHAASALKGRTFASFPKFIDAFALVDRKELMHDEAPALGVVQKTFVSGVEPTMEDPVYALIDRAQTEVAERELDVPSGMARFIKTLSRGPVPEGRRRDLEIFLRDLERLRRMGLSTIDFIGNILMDDGRLKMVELSVHAEDPTPYDIVWFSS